MHQFQIWPPVGATFISDKFVYLGPIKKNMFPNTRYTPPSTKYLNTNYILPNTSQIHLNTRYTLPNTKRHFPNSKYLLLITMAVISSQKIDFIGWRVWNIWCSVCSLISGSFSIDIQNQMRAAASQKKIMFMCSSIWLLLLNSIPHSFSLFFRMC